MHGPVLAGQVRERLADDGGSGDERDEEEEVADGGGNEWEETVVVEEGGSEVVEHSKDALTRYVSCYHLVLGNREWRLQCRARQLAAGGVGGSRRSSRR